MDTTPPASIIEVQDLFFTRPFYMIYIGGGIGVLGLLLVIILAPRSQKSEELQDSRRKRHFHHLSQNTYEVLRFLFISIIALTAMMTLALTDVQISPLSPLGLIIKAGPDNNTQTDNQWVLNIGGIASNNYSSGIQIPVNVVIFGIAGGYLRFLYYTSRKGSTTSNGNTQAAEEKDDQEQQKIEVEPFYETLKDLSLFFLSPLLAVAVWLVLLQGGMTSIFTLAAVSLAVGLVTREVVNALISFVTSMVSPKTQEHLKKENEL